MSDYAQMIDDDIKLWLRGSGRQDKEIWDRLAEERQKSFFAGKKAEDEPYAVSLMWRRESMKHGAWADALEQELYSRACKRFERVELQGGDK